ncbi:MAG: hypothetical protein ACM3SR_00310 [Ignavibacteriales bacterium]
MTDGGATTGLGDVKTGAGIPKPKFRKTSVRAIDDAGTRRIKKRIDAKKSFFNFYTPYFLRQLWKFE